MNEIPENVIYKSHSKDAVFFQLAPTFGKQRILKFRTIQEHLQNMNKSHRGLLLVWSICVFVCDNTEVLECLIPETFTRNLRARAEKNVCAIRRLSLFVQTIAVDQHM